MKSDVTWTHLVPVGGGGGNRTRVQLRWNTVTARDSGYRSSISHRIRGPTEPPKHESRLERPLTSSPTSALLSAMASLSPTTLTMAEQALILRVTKATLHNAVTGRTLRPIVAEPNWAVHLDMWRQVCAR